MLDLEYTLGRGASTSDVIKICMFLMLRKLEIKLKKVKFVSLISMGSLKEKNVCL